ncbi:hypothetical protein XENTR_v10019575 [Xenopus tropicalis]|nr:hypothetical protein XENTR_v10019575 [Xenopus tropicalis]
MDSSISVNLRHRQKWEWSSFCFCFRQNTFSIVILYKGTCPLFSKVSLSRLSKAPEYCDEQTYICEVAPVLPVKIQISCSLEMATTISKVQNL